MKAVNLLPEGSQRARASGGRGTNVNLGGLGPGAFIVGLLLVVVLIVLARVLEDNTVNNKKATLAAVQAQVVTEQAEAAKLAPYVTAVQTAQARETQVREIAEQRFNLKRTFDQISRVTPKTTSLTSLSASTTATATTNQAGVAVSGPTFTLAGCADTANQHGMATLLRRLTVLSGVSNVGFQSSTRTSDCGNSFSIVLTFNAPGMSSTAGTSGTTSAVPATTATATTTAPTTTSPTGTATTTP